MALGVIPEMDLDVIFSMLVLAPQKGLRSKNLVEVVI